MQYILLMGGSTYNLKLKEKLMSATTNCSPEICHFFAGMPHVCWPSCSTMLSRAGLSVCSALLSRAEFPGAGVFRMSKGVIGFIASQLGRLQNNATANLSPPCFLVSIQVGVGSRCLVPCSQGRN